MTVFRPQRGFSSRILLVIVGLTLFGSFLTAVLAGYFAYQDLKYVISDNLRSAAFQMAFTLDREIFERLREVEFLARRNVLSESAVSASAKRSQLSQVQRGLSAHAWIALTDQRGVVLAATGGILEGHDLSGHPWFAGAKSAPYVGDVHEGQLLARFLPGHPDESQLFMEVAAPVFGQDGEFKGVLCSYLTWEWARQVVKNLFLPARQDSGMDIVVYNASGQPILSPDSVPGKWPALEGVVSEELRAHGHALTTWPDGREYLTGYAASKGYANFAGLGWTVVARQRADTALLPVLALERKILVSGGALGLLAALAGLVTARRMVRPLIAITRSAEAIRMGDKSASIPALPGDDELAVLSKALSALVRDLEGQNAQLSEAKANLESRVAQRTRALSEAVEALENEIEARKAMSDALAKNEAHLKDAQHLAQVGSFEYDAASPQAMVWSEEMFRILGYEPAGQATLDMLLARVHPEDRSELLGLLLKPACACGMLEFRVLVPGGGEKYLSGRLDLQAATGEACRLRLCTVRDVTERRKAQLFQREMERIAAHDLKAPLNAIINLPALHFDDENIDPELLEDLKIIKESGLRMLEHINRTLSVYRLEAGIYQLKPSEVNCVSLALETASQLSALARTRKVDLKLSLEGKPLEPCGVLMAQADALLVNTMLANLLKNALEVSSEGDQVELCLARENGHAVFRVHNSQPVPERIMSTFFNKSTTLGKSGGVGLGTYSARLSAEAHGGFVRLETSRASGTTVTAAIPIRPSATPQQREPEYASW